MKQEGGKTAKLTFSYACMWPNIVNLEDLITPILIENEYLYGVKHNHSYGRVLPEFGQTCSHRVVGSWRVGSWLYVCW